MLSDLSYRLQLQQRALARGDLHQRSRGFHFEAARNIAARLIAGENDAEQSEADSPGAPALTTPAAAQLAPADLHATQRAPNRLPALPASVAAQVHP